MQPARLRVFECAFTLSFACYMTARFLHAEEWLTDAGFHYTSDNYSKGEGPPLPLLPLWGAHLLALMFSTIIWFSLQMMCFYILFSPVVFFAKADRNSRGIGVIAPR